MILHSNTSIKVFFLISFEYLLIGSLIAQKIAAKGGLNKIRIHDLRHTFTSLLFNDGQPMKYVMDQLGHISINVTVDIYGNLTPGGNKSAVDSLDDEPENATVCNLYATK